MNRPDSNQPGSGSAAAVAAIDGAPDGWPDGRTHELRLRVANPGPDQWSSDDDPPVRLGVRWFRDGAVVGPEGRIDLPHPLDPGDAVELAATVTPPGPGSWRLSIDLVREHVAWLDAGFDWDVEVGPPKRIVVTGGFSPYRHLGDDLIMRAVLGGVRAQAPDHDVVLLADNPAQARAAYGVPTVGGANPMLHRLRPASPALALRRIVALRRDAARVRDGHDATDPLHAPLLAALHGAAALVAPGAGWFTSKYRIEQMLPRLAEVEAARVLGVPVLFESGTVGPFEGLLDRRLARRTIAGLHRLTVRDGVRSADTARALGAEEAIEVPDAATAFPPGPAAERDAWLAEHGIDPARPYAVVSVRDTRDPTAVGDSDATFDTLVAALEVVAERDIQAVFLPHCIAPETDDRPAGRAVAERVPLLVHDDMPPDDVAVAMVHGAALAVGNRFHLALVADAAGTPALFLAATPFDDLRSGAFTGGNVAVVRSEPGGTAGAAAAAERLDRGHGAPGPRWDPADLGRALSPLIAGD